MKAYLAWDNMDIDRVQTIVFAENEKDAKKIAFRSNVFEYADYIQVRVNRYPKADNLYKGRPEIDWYDDETRLYLVKCCFWQCLDTSYECDTCVAKKYCGHWEDSDVT